MPLRFSWDWAKYAENLKNHKLDFQDAGVMFAMEADMYVYQVQRNGEFRHVGIGMHKGKLHTVVFVHRAGLVRLISWRRSNEKAIRAYNKARNK